MAVPILLNVIAGYAVCATKEYQTSAEVVSPQNADILAVAVALTPLSLSVPPVLTHDMPGVNMTALPQASLAGCANEATEKIKLKRTNNTILCKENRSKFFFIGKNFED